MNKDYYAFKKRRNTSNGFFNTQDNVNKRIGEFVPYQQRRVVAEYEKSAHFKLGKSLCQQQDLYSYRG